MNIQDRHRLQAELGELDKMIATTPAEFVIERHGLESRKQEIETLLAAHPAPLREPARASLTFRGKPVIGTHGIFAEFAASAVAAFTDAVATIGASASGALGARGVIPGRDRYQMLITGAAVGSFGFQLEESPLDGQLQLSDESEVGAAIEQAESLMRATLGTDDELTEIVSDLDPRAIESVRKFLETLSTNEAVCALDYKGAKFQFADVSQVRRSLARIQQDNIQCQDLELIGTFEGVLPKRRTFQFHVAETDEVLIGKIAKEIEAPAEINQVLEQAVKASVTKKVVGSGAPRYLLTGYQPQTSPQAES